MTIAVLHLSDIHIKTKQDMVIGKATAIAATLNSVTDTVQKCVILLTGDIAHSGASEQYDVAFDFLEDSKAAESARAELAKPPPREFYYFLVPFLLIVCCCFYLVLACYPSATFNWGDEVARYDALLQRRKFVWGALIVGLIVSVTANVLTTGLMHL